MPVPTYAAAIVDGDTMLRLSSTGWVTFIQEHLELEGGGVIPPQEIRVDFFELIDALATARQQIKETLGHDPFDRPEDRKVDSDS